MDAERVVPQDIEAEEAVLGALLIDPEALGKVPFLRATDFYRGRHGSIYAAMLDLSTRGIVSDFQTLVSELERADKLDEVGGASYIAGLVSATPTSAHVVHYAKRVEHCSTLRRVIAAAGAIAREAYDDPADLDELLAKVETEVYDVRRQRQTGRIVTPSERARIASERYDHRQQGGSAGIPFGLQALDKWTQGAEPGQLILFAGRPGSGKSSILQNIAENMSREGRKVLFASAEMPDEQLTDRHIAAAIGMPMHSLQAGGHPGQTMAQISGALVQLAKTGWYACDESDMTTTGLRSRAVEMRGRHGLDAIFVDYLQILNDHVKGNEVERVTTISRNLKHMARSLQVPVIAAAQLSRAVEHRDNKRPQLADLRESGSLEQDADIVVMIYRESYYSKDPNDDRAELIIAKQRNGPAGITSPLWFDRRLTRFQDAPIGEAPRYAPVAPNQYADDYDVV